MRRVVIVVVVLLCLIGAAAAFWGLGGVWRWPGPGLETAVAPKAPSATPSPEPSQSTQIEAPAVPKPDSPFDVAKIDPNGASVFAGRAKPNGHVTVFADGKAVGSANTDENGEWVVIAEGGIASADPKLTVEFSAGRISKSDQVASGGGTRQEGEKDKPEPPSATGQAAEKVTEGLVDNLRRLVDRERAQGGEAAAPSASDKPTAGSTGTEVAKAGSAAAPGDAVDPTAGEQQKRVEGSPPNEVLVDSKPELALRETNGPQAQTGSVPVPIKFVFNEAVLTKDGRETAELLVEYVMLKKFSSLELTGHADERGRHDYNLALSSERLETVAAMLRKAGYSGKLRLIPKGETEPFTGVDRSKFPQEVLFELDRRVELREALP